MVRSSANARRSLPRKFVIRTCMVPGLPGSRQAASLGRWYLSKFMPLARLVVSQRSETNLVSVSVITSEASALRSITLKVTPFLVTACLGSGKRIEAGVQPWQMPNQVGMQYPLVLPSRLAQISPSADEHCELAVQPLDDDCPSMPLALETASTMPEAPYAFWYFSEGARLL